MAVKAYFVGIFLLLAAIEAVEGANQKVIIDIPGSLIMNGKNISVIGSSSDSISVDVDGVLENVMQDFVTNEPTFVNGVFIQIIALSRSPQRAVLNIVVLINCGNNICESGEDFAICCADCGCSTSNQVCSNNQCIENIKKSSAKHQCYTDEDCNDHNACTTERCDTTEFPNRCIRTDISACVAGDACCPKLCDTDRDADCANIDKCESDADCTDNEACTQEVCQGTPKRCQYTHQNGCTYENACILKGTVKEGKFCEGKSHEWLSQKVDEQACTEDFECIAGICNNDLCGQTQSRTLRYAFYTIGIVAVIIIMWYVSLTRRPKPSQ